MTVYKSFATCVHKVLQLSETRSKVILSNGQSYDCVLDEPLKVNDKIVPGFDEQNRIVSVTRLSS